MKISERMLTFFSTIVVLFAVIHIFGGIPANAMSTPKENTVTKTKSEEVVETTAEIVPKVVEETVAETTIPEETIPEFVYEEQIPGVPLYFQQDYAHVYYGGGENTVSSNGCGIVSLSMVFTYLFDEPILPDRLAKEYRGKGSSSGTCWTLFLDSAADYGLDTVVKTWDWKLVKAALQRGQVVIANARSNTVFTDGGHYIVLAGITEDGRVIVRDPNRYNYSAREGSVLAEGFSKGFEQKYVNCCSQYWIYPHKDYAALSAEAEAEYYAQFQ